MNPSVLFTPSWIGHEKRPSRACGELYAVVFFVDGLKADTPGFCQELSVPVQFTPVDLCVSVAGVGSDPVVRQLLQRINKGACQC